MAKAVVEGVKLIAKNSKAFHDYHVHDTFEAGLLLLGTEVKSIRDGKAQLADSYARSRDGELWLFHCDIPPYRYGGHVNHEPKRPRKLLLHRREIEKIRKLLEQKGYSLVPMRMYFKRGIVKIEMAMVSGKKKHDRREDIKQRDAQRHIARVMRKR